ncbi:hypothetical protein ON010_g14788 [Phytophthora cinnamomi]|nr:hypothetical protein ON010_g14788 [Phytophthora cinnamomi]
MFFGVTLLRHGRHSSEGQHRQAQQDQRGAGGHHGGAARHRRGSAQGAGGGAAVPVAGGQGAVHRVRPVRAALDAARAERRALGVGPGGAGPQLLLRGAGRAQRDARGRGHRVQRDAARALRRPHALPQVQGVRQVVLQRVPHAQARAERAAGAAGGQGGAGAGGRRQPGRVAGQRRGRGGPGLHGAYVAPALRLRHHQDAPHEGAGVPDHARRVRQERQPQPLAHAAAPPELAAHAHPPQRRGERHVLALARQTETAVESAEFSEYILQPPADDSVDTAAQLVFCIKEIRVGPAGILQDERRVGGVLLLQHSREVSRDEPGAVRGRVNVYGQVLHRDDAVHRDDVPAGVITDAQRGGSRALRQRPAAVAVAVFVAGQPPLPHAQQASARGLTDLQTRARKHTLRISTCPLATQRKTNDARKPLGHRTKILDQVTTVRKPQSRQRQISMIRHPVGGVVVKTVNTDVMMIVGEIDHHRHPLEIVTAETVSSAMIFDEGGRHAPDLALQALEVGIMVTVGTVVAPGQDHGRKRGRVIMIIAIRSGLFRRDTDKSGDPPELGEVCQNGEIEERESFAKKQKIFHHADAPPAPGALATFDDDGDNMFISDSDDDGSALVKEVEDIRFDLDSVSVDKALMARQVYVTGVNPTVCAEQIEEDFARFGVAVDQDTGFPAINVFPSQRTHVGRGDACVTFETEEGAQEAVEELNSKKRQKLDDPPSVRAAHGARFKSPRSEATEFTWEGGG